MRSALFLCLVVSASACAHRHSTTPTASCVHVQDPPAPALPELEGQFRGPEAVARASFVARVLILVDSYHLHVRQAATPATCHCLKRVHTITTTNGQVQEDGPDYHSFFAHFKNAQIQLEKREIFLAVNLASQAQGNTIVAGPAADVPPEILEPLRRGDRLQVSYAANGVAVLQPVAVADNSGVVSVRTHAR